MILNDEISRGWDVLNLKICMQYKVYSEFLFLCKIVGNQQ